IPLPYLAYPGMLVEIEGYAMRGENDEPLQRQVVVSPAASRPPAPFLQGLRCGKMIFVSGQTPVDEKGGLVLPNDIIGQTRQVMKQIGLLLQSCGADFEDVVKINRWYVGHGTVEDFEPAALALGSTFKKTATGTTALYL